MERPQIRCTHTNAPGADTCLKQKILPINALSADAKFSFTKTERADVKRTAAAAVIALHAEAAADLGKHCLWIFAAVIFALAMEEHYAKRPLCNTCNRIKL